MSTTIDEKEPAPADSADEADKRRRFGELVAAHQAQIRSFVGSLGVSRTSVDDVAQEAFVIAYKKFDSYEPGTSFVAWVCTIARNVLLNDRRKAKRRHELLNEVVTDLFLEDDPSSELEARDESMHRSSALHGCLNQMPERSRELVNLRYRKGLGPSTIADDYGVSADSIRSRLQRVRDSLRRCLATRLGDFSR